MRRRGRCGKELAAAAAPVCSPRMASRAASGLTGNGAFFVPMASRAPENPGSRMRREDFCNEPLEAAPLTCIAEISVPWPCCRSAGRSRRAPESTEAEWFMPPTAATDPRDTPPRTIRGPSSPAGLDRGEDLPRWGRPATGSLGVRREWLSSRHHLRAAGPTKAAWRSANRARSRHGRQNLESS